jgi:16S rRNA (adenine1518-N6/adenine1519-N6)-dimethyltransferase
MLTRTQVGALLDRHGLEPSRALGQNFLVEPNVVNRIAEVAGVGPGDRVVEVGAGVGCLTLALAATGAEVVAVELDNYLLPVLAETLTDTSVKVVHGDAASLDWDDLLGTEHPWTLVANLPYNVGTNIVLDMLDRVPQVTRMVVMVQQEVASRLTAELPSREAGIPSVKVAYWGSASVRMAVSPECFMPRPRVDSAVVEIVRSETPNASADRTVLFELVRTAFGQRRKMIRKSLAGRVSADAFDTSGVSPQARPEALTLAEWSALADAV